MPWGSLVGADTTLLFSHAPHRLAWIFALNGVIVFVFCPHFFPTFRNTFRILTSRPPQKGVSWIARI
jgi:hypothetical protein